MSSKSKPLTDKELAAYEAGRDLAADLLRAVQEIKAGQLQVVLSPVIEARKKTDCLSQSQFTAVTDIVVNCPVTRAAGGQALRGVRWRGTW